MPYLNEAMLNDTTLPTPTLSSQLSTAHATRLVAVMVLLQEDVGERGEVLSRHVTEYSIVVVCADGPAVEIQSISVARHVDVAQANDVVGVRLNAYGIKVDLAVFQVDERSARGSRSRDDGGARCRQDVIRDERVADGDGGTVRHFHSVAALRVIFTLSMVTALLATLVPANSMPSPPQSLMLVS